MPGIATSRIRHVVAPTQPDERNSGADEKTWAEKPNSLSKSGSDSRTDSSSSTTDRSGRSLTPLRSRDPMTKQCATLSVGVHCTLVLLWPDLGRHTGITPP